MNTTKPIKSYKDIQKLKNYYLERGEYRNYLLVSVCLNSALRISDVLTLKWDRLYSFSSHRVKTHISIKEKKTGKRTEIFINAALKSAVKLYIKNKGLPSDNAYIFTGENTPNLPLTRTQAHRIIKSAGNALGLDISCHSLRKTFGYQAWKQGVPPVMLMKVYNHSAFSITKRYLGIEQEDKDKIFETVKL